eukprot:CAMPEP_0176256288 /NCGR_PEP_ID=MMETSP0121_2-20121125/37468_1 /TAXON_ID=160619 /ORGANISM="Kryptoperidinium foliaceum, Strain CCMP 1326" /LENGTH=211 /DNA_ID=CAMNT_0017596119 /DNA_START=264 /DNA_END=895 /DNA_ORIENTATION=+
MNGDVAQSEKSVLQAVFRQNARRCLTASTQQLHTNDFWTLVDTPCETPLLRCFEHRNAQREGKHPQLAILQPPEFANPRPLLQADLETGAEHVGKISAVELHHHPRCPHREDAPQDAGDSGKSRGVGLPRIQKELGQVGVGDVMQLRRLNGPTPRDHPRQDRNVLAAERDEQSMRRRAAALNKRISLPILGARAGGAADEAQEVLELGIVA